VDADARNEIRDELPRWILTVMNVHAKTARESEKPNEDEID
jgi:hypothetical protein